MLAFSGAYASAANGHMRNRGAVKHDRKAGWKMQR